MNEARADIGLIGLAVMGQNIVLNMDDHGYTVAVFNRTVSKVDEFLSHEAAGTKVIGMHSIQELCAALKRRGFLYIGFYRAGMQEGRTHGSAPTSILFTDHR